MGDKELNELSMDDLNMVSGGQHYQFDLGTVTVKGYSGSGFNLHDYHRILEFKRNSCAISEDLRSDFNIGLNYDYIFTDLPMPYSSLRCTEVCPGTRTIYIHFATQEEADAFGTKTATLWY